MQLQKNALSQNRAEEYGQDVWEHFVVPPFYDKLDLIQAKKPRIIIGGRGCGKTMLLRYVCHDTIFSSLRNYVPSEEYKHIGLYWRIDTQISGLLKGRGMEDDVWTSALQHYAVVHLSLELIRCLQNLADRHDDNVKIELNKFDLLFASDYLNNDVLSFDELYLALKREMRNFHKWVNNITTISVPVFLSIEFLKDFIAAIREGAKKLKASTVYVYIDEFENLEAFQKPIINTWLKHSQSPLIFNIAAKKGFDVTDTLSEEKLVDIHDYRKYNIENFLKDDDTFKIFAAEILYLNLADDASYEKYKAILQDPTQIKARNKTTYKRTILKLVNMLYPTYSYKEICQQILKDTNLRKRLIDVLETALNKRTKHSKIQYQVDEFIDNNFPEQSVVLPFLIGRQRNTISGLLKEFQNLKEGHPNKFEQPTDWTKGLVVAAILYIYEPLNRPCPLYSGFDSFCRMSHGNIRYLLELCHKSQQWVADNTVEHNFANTSSVVKWQAEASRQASYSFLNEIRSLGKKGNQLYTFVYRLGFIFQLAGKNPLLSEPEITHFSLKSNNILVDDNIESFLNEAIKWSVLYEYKSTKQKNNNSIEDFDYFLNPIYAPFFHISYRKMRKLELDRNTVSILINGSDYDFKHMVRIFQKRWNIELNEPQALNLFDI